MRGIRYVAGFLLLLAASVQASAAPPEQTYLRSVASSADTVKVPAGSFADVSVEVPQGGAINWTFSVRPVRVADGLPEGRVIFGAAPGTTVTATATIVAVDFEKKKTTFTVKDYIFVFEGTGPQPPPVIPPVKPPVDPVVTPPATALYFLVVGADGPVAPAVTKSLQLPEWATLAGNGHMYKYKTGTEAAALGVKLPAGTALPTVVILQNRPDGKSTQLGVAPLPTTGAEVLALPEKVGK